MKPVRLGDADQISGPWRCLNIHVAGTFFYLAIAYLKPADKLADRAEAIWAVRRQ